MFILALVRFPPTATKEIQYLNAKGALTYTDIAGDPVLYGTLPPREICMQDAFRSESSCSETASSPGSRPRTYVRRPSGRSAGTEPPTGTRPPGRVHGRRRSSE